MANRLLLWDIDGTLISGARSAAIAFVAALREVYALDGELAKIAYGGKTDGQIVRETLALHGFAEDAISAGWPAFEARYRELFAAAEARLAREVRILDGVPALLADLRPHAHHALLTGNIRPAAEQKLRAADLHAAFDWEASAFGCDHHHRPALVAKALERAAARGLQASPATTTIIGDTPHDIACARAAGVRVVAVATGSFSRAELAAADAVFDTLADPAAPAAILG